MILLFWIIVYSIFILIDLVPLFQEKDWKQFWIYTTVLACAFALTMAVSFKIKVPSPSVPIEAVVKYLLGLS